MKLLTISIAAYNVEEYIGQTLDSLIDERIIDQLEVFVVDDGGTDRTLEIAKEYAEKYPESIIPVHKENGGYGSTVNYSIANATGKYFKLLDGDDWFDCAGLYTLVQSLKMIDADLFLTPYYRCIRGEETETITIPVKAETLFQASELGDCVPALAKENNCLAMWMLCYKTEMLRACSLELPQHSLYTDTVFATIPLSVIRTVYYLPVPVYFYRIGREGQSVSRASRVRHTEEKLRLHWMLCAFYEEKKREKNPNCRIIRHLVSGNYGVSMMHLFFEPVSKESLKKIKRLERETCSFSRDVYLGVTPIGKMGKLLWVLRRTFYLPYWGLKIIPGGFRTRY